VNRVYATTTHGMSNSFTVSRYGEYKLSVGEVPVEGFLVGDGAVTIALGGGDDRPNLLSIMDGRFPRRSA
jgi:hypothetical protein